MNSKQTKNNTEDLLWDSIDVLMNELAEHIADYIRAETNAVINRLRTGLPRSFEAIYSEFIDEIIANGLYDEYINYLKFRRRYFEE